MSGEVYKHCLIDLIDANLKPSVQLFLLPVNQNTRRVYPHTHFCEMLYCIMSEFVDSILFKNLVLV